MKSVKNKTQLAEKQKTKKKKLQKKAIRRVLIRKQNESNREIEQNERKQKRGNVVEDIDSGRFFELAITNKRYVIGLNLHEIKNEILEDYTGDFELIGSMMIGEIEQKTKIRLNNFDHFET